MGFYAGEMAICLGLIQACSCAHARAERPPCSTFPLAICPTLQQGIQKLIRLLEGQPESQFNAEQYMMLYT